MRTLVIVFLTFNLVTCKSQIEESIVLVNVGNLDRADIARVISIINALSPRVVAIDLQFAERKNKENDQKLIQALWNTQNLVMPSRIKKFGGEVVISLGSQAEFAPAQVKSGFIDALPESDQFGTLKRFITHEQGAFDQGVEYHFAVATAMAFDSIGAAKFVRAHSKITGIDYKDGKRSFKKYEAIEVFSGKLTKRDIEGKIIMIGFLGPGNEDKFYTPLNKNPKEPDMYGLEYLANIVVQVLEYGD